MQAYYYSYRINSTMPYIISITICNCTLSDVRVATVQHIRLQLRVFVADFSSKIILAIQLYLYIYEAILGFENYQTNMLCH